MCFVIIYWILSNWLNVHAYFSVEKGKMSSFCTCGTITYCKLYHMHKKFDVYRKLSLFWLGPGPDGPDRPVRIEPDRTGPDCPGPD